MSPTPSTAADATAVSAVSGAPEDGGEAVAVHLPAGRGPAAITAALAALIPLLSIAWAIDVPRLLGVAFFNEQFVAAFLGIALAVVYLSRPLAGGSRGRLPWYDAIAAAAALAAAGYVAIYYPSLLERLWMRPTDALVVGVVLLLLTLEGLRRAAGLAMLVLVLASIGFALLGHLVPGALQGRQVPPERLIVYLSNDSGALLGLPLLIVATVVVSFVLFGNLLHKAGGGAFFTDLAMSLMGRYRGGPAKVAVTASALFGSVSGSAVANVASTGVITIPLMKKAGYRPHQAGAIEAVASTGGQLMPPVMGAAAFLMAELLQISYADVVLAALVPALLYYAALFIQVDLLAARDGLVAADPKTLPRVRAVLATGGIFALPFAVLIYALFSLNQQPEYAAVLAAASVVVIGLFLRLRHGPGGLGLSLRALPGVLTTTGLGVTDIVMIGAAAGIVIGVMNVSALGFAITLSLVGLGAGNLPALLIIAAIASIVLGMGMPTLGVYLLLATLIAPALVEVGIQPIAAHLFVLYFGMMSMITPPVAIAAFAAASISGAGPMRTGWSAMAFGWSAYAIPFIFVCSPALLLIGDPGTVVLATATALSGVWLISAAVVGRLFARLPSVQRLPLAAAGLLLLIPHTDTLPLWTDLAGAALGVLLVLWNLRTALAARPAVAAAGPIVESA